MKKFFLFVASRFKENKVIQIGFYIYSAFCLFSLVWFIIGKAFVNITFSIAFLFVGFVPFIAEYVVRLKESASFYISYLIFNALSLLGPAYDLYTPLKSLDTLIHLFSGFLFSALGFALASKFINQPDKPKNNFFGCLLFGLLFCLSCGYIWELMEYFGTAFFGVDNQEDTLLTSFISYGLSGTRNNVVIVDNISRTVIYYVDSSGVEQSITIDGGYYDLGLIDTILDMLACLAGSIIFSIISLVSFSNKKKFINSYIPKSTTPFNVEE